MAVAGERLLLAWSEDEPRCIFPVCIYSETLHAAVLSPDGDVIARADLPDEGEPDSRNDDGYSISLATDGDQFLLLHMGNAIILDADLQVLNLTPLSGLPSLGSVIWSGDRYHAALTYQSPSAAWLAQWELDSNGNVIGRTRGAEINALSKPSIASLSSPWTVTGLAAHDPISGWRGLLYDERAMQVLPERPAAPTLTEVNVTNEFRKLSWAPSTDPTVTHYYVQHLCFDQARRGYQVTETFWFPASQNSFIWYASLGVGRSSCTQARVRAFNAAGVSEPVLYAPPRRRPVRQ
jgi:hypothetical protein